MTACCHGIRCIYYDSMDAQRGFGKSHDTSGLGHCFLNVVGVLVDESGRRPLNVVEIIRHGVVAVDRLEKKLITFIIK